MTDQSNGFTLVELAIVITIIGLLIGGVLKGQELLQNTRVTSTASQLKSFSAAAMTFRDIYKYLPGDLPGPSSFIQNCTASPCNIAGDGNGTVGPVGGFGDENNTFWLHLAKAGLISGIDPNSNWTSGTRFAASYPDMKMGGVATIYYMDFTPAAVPRWPDGVHGHYWFLFQPSADRSTYGLSIPLNYFAKLDLKVDDGRPWQGDYVLDSNGCGISDGATAYDPNISAACDYNVRAF